NSSQESSLNLDDSGDLKAETGTITPTSITGFGMGSKASITYGQNEKLDLSERSGLGTNKFTITGGTGAISLIANAAASNTLVGPNKKVEWDINGINSGSITDIHLAFTNFQNLIGGTLADTFAFSDGGSIAGTIDGGTGRNTLDYSNGWTGNVVANLQTGKTSGVGKTIANFQIIDGATGGGAGFYNILIGNGGNDLTGGDGRSNLLDAGGKGSMLQGGDENDILIGGTTIYDKQTNNHSLIAVMVYWSNSTASYAITANNLLLGTGVPALSATTVHSSGVKDALLGHDDSPTDLNLYFGLGPAKENNDRDEPNGELFEKV
ncbi:MAG TPA: hypothetical protein VGN88_00335, partial [Phycisphaerae bacterium]